MSIYDWGQGEPEVTDIIAAWVINVHSPSKSPTLDMDDKRLLANLPAMLEQAEENLQDLMPEGYRVSIKEWNSE